VATKRVATKSATNDKGARAAKARSTSPVEGRELRRQGKRTMAKLTDAGMRVLSERGYHAARVDDIVRLAKVSHGTFYLYFSNKEDLFRALAVECADEMTHLTDSLDEVTADDGGTDELRRWLAEFVTTYRKYGVVIRAWMEDQVTSRELARLGRRTFNAITQSLVERLQAVHGDDHDAEVAAAAMLAMIERTTYFVTSRDLPFDDDELVDTLATMIHRGFFVPAAA
jgi:AcrR family transcriptional regulator